MPDQLTDRARTAAEEIIQNIIRRPSRDWMDDIYEIIVRHMRELQEEKNLDAEKSRQFNESEIRRFEENHKEVMPCPEK